jgi:hypothetical protein
MAGDGCYIRRLGRYRTANGEHGGGKQRSHLVFHGLGLFRKIRVLPVFYGRDRIVVASVKRDVLRQKEHRSGVDEAGMRRVIARTSRCPLMPGLNRAPLV